MEAETGMMAKEADGQWPGADSPQSLDKELALPIL
jgi:hypothetical protein